MFKNGFFARPGSQDPDVANENTLMRPWTYPCLDRIRGNSLSELKLMMILLELKFETRSEAALVGGVSAQLRQTLMDQARLTVLRGGTASLNLIMKSRESVLSALKALHVGSTCHLDTTFGIVSPVCDRCGAISKFGVTMLSVANPRSRRRIIWPLVMAHTDATGVTIGEFLSHWISSCTPVQASLPFEYRTAEDQQAFLASPTIDDVVEPTPDAVVRCFGGAITCDMGDEMVRGILLSVMKTWSQSASFTFLKQLISSLPDRPCLTGDHRKDIDTLREFWRSASNAILDGIAAARGPNRKHIEYAVGRHAVWFFHDEYHVLEASGRAAIRHAHAVYAPAKKAASEHNLSKAHLQRRPKYQQTLLKQVDRWFFEARDPTTLRASVEALVSVLRGEKFVKITFDTDPRVASDRSVITISDGGLGVGERAEAELLQSKIDAEPDDEVDIGPAQQDDSVADCTAGDLEELVDEPVSDEEIVLSSPSLALTFVVKKPPVRGPTGLSVSSADVDVDVCVMPKSDDDAGAYTSRRRRKGSSIRVTAGELMS